jgi:hypothetical protein
MQYTDLIDIYNFSLIEQAVQRFFVALPGGAFVSPPSNQDPAKENWMAEGQIAFYTAFQSAVFQKSRPQVYCALTNITEYPQTHIIDANGVWRASAWKGVLHMGVVTSPDYTAHTQLRAAVLAALPTLQPPPTADGSGIAASGINALTQFHEIGLFQMQATETMITPQAGDFKSVIPVTITFSVRVSAWPGGIQNA